MSWHEWQEALPGDFAVLGDPISHSLSPLIHSRAYQISELPYSYHALRVRAGELSNALEHLIAIGYRGVNVTLPLKEEAFRWAEKVEGIGQKLGVVNTLNLKSKIGLNTDAPGFIETIADCGLRRGDNVLVLGAGGTAQALIPILIETGFRVKAWNRTKSRLETLAKNQDLEFEILDCIDPAGSKLILNTTSAGITGEALPIKWQNTESNSVAYDVVYGKEMTPFLLEASKRGLLTIDGSKMLVAQAALSFEWWLGKSAPREAMLKAINEHFESHP